MNLTDVDILKADDATLRVLAAEAMGWSVEIKETPCWQRERWTNPHGQLSRTPPNAPVCLDDAVALADHVCRGGLEWEIHRSWSQDGPAWGSAEVFDPTSEKAIGNLSFRDVKGSDADGNLARALTRAVLLALQSAERQEQTA